MVDLPLPALPTWKIGRRAGTATPSATRSPITTESRDALFTVDTRFAVFMDGEGTDPTCVLEGREALTPVFADLNRYDVTRHSNGQSTVAIDGIAPRVRATRSPTTSTARTTVARS
jgi:hypothetical protein